MKDYKRLTKKYPYYESAFYEMDCTNCMFKLIPCKKDIHCFKASLQRLGELEDKIEQGLILELPCKVGDTIFFIYEYCSAEGKECIACDKGCVHGISHQEDGIWVHARYESGLTYWHKEDDIGEIVFFTKAEAEAKLADLRGGK